MNPILIIAKNEWQVMVRNKIAVGLLLVFTIILVMAAYIGIDNTLKQNAFRQKYQTEVQNQWNSQPDRHPHRVAHYGYLAFREKSPLSFFDFGIETFVGNAVFLEAHRQNTVNLSEAGFSNGMLRFGELSMALVLQLFVPLFIFFVGFGTIAGLRENGVLKLILSQGVSMKTLIWGKILGIFSFSSAFFLSMMFSGFIASALFIPEIMGQDLSIRIILIVFLYTTFFAVCSWAAVMVSAYSNKSGNALITLILIWMVCGVILPKVAQTVGTGIYPSISKLEFEKNIEEDMSKEGDSHNPEDPHYAAFKAQTLEHYGVESIEQLPFNYSGYVMAEGERITSGLFNRHFEKLMASYKNQNSIAIYLGFINPFLMVRNVSMILSGTDLEHYIDFQRQAETYRYNQAQWLNEIHTHEIKRIDDKAQRVSNANFQNYTVFKYESPEIFHAMNNPFLSVLYILSWMILICFSVALFSNKIPAI
jgi:ABC-2 type transport system permease protein